MPDTSISSLRASIISDLDAQALVFGEHTPLTQANQNTVSYSVDAKNETWNPSLGTRPH